MPAQTSASRSTFTRSKTRAASALGAVLIGVIYLLLYIAGNLIASPVSLILELLLLVAVVSVLSIIGGIGYWMSKTWGWFVHLASVLGQLLFPGGLFEFKPDLYHMIGWIGPLISLVILIAMGIHIRQKRPE